MGRRYAKSRVMFRRKARRWALLISATLLGLFLVAGVLALTGDGLPALAAKDPLQAAWEKVRRAGSYHFEAEVRQETIPIARPTNIGLSGQADVYFMAGDAAPPDHLWARLWQGEKSAARADTASELLMRDGQVYVRPSPRAAWRKQDNPLQLTAPAGDYLNFFQAAEAVTFEGYEIAGGLRYARYSFQLDGARYAQLLEEQLNREIASQIAGGAEVQVPAAIRQTRGQGQAWLTEDGLPARMTLELRVPNADDRYRVRGSIRVDFSDFGNPLVTPADAPSEATAGLKIPLPKLGILSDARGELVNPAEASVVVVPWSSLAAALFLALAIQAVRHRGRKKVYALLALLVIVSMALTPLLRAIHLDRFFRAREAHAAAGPGQLEKLARSPVLDGLVPRPAAYDDIEPPVLAELVQTEGAPLPDDGAGEYDVVPYAPPPTAPQADSGVDTDGDGLSDDYEVHVGTDPLEPDSDFDGLNDNLEVLGFSYNSQQWYSNPAHPDSNADGLADKAEWHYPGESTVVHDPDGDGTPNLWDDDNDDDDVPDRVDLSPFSRSDWTTWGQRFSVRASAQHPLYVNVQIRPQNEAHLRYAMKSLDWPYDYRGNMTDVNDSKEDLTLVPYLEISDLAAIPPGLAEANPYGIMADTANRRLYVPLTPVSVGGQVVAFSAKLFLEANPQASNHAIDGQMRLTWMVRAKVDEVEERDNYNVVYATDEDTVAKVYAPDPFRVTGMTVSEQMNADAAAIYIHPSASPEEDDPLHQAVSALTMSFLSYDTFTLTQMTSAQFAAWGITTTARPADTLLVAHLDYKHEDELLAQMMMTTTKGILGNYSTAITPTVLFAYEHRSRLQTLEQANTAGQINANQFVFDLANVHDSTERGVTLHKYRHNGDEWEVLPTEGLLTEVERLYGGDVDVDDETLDLLKLWYLVWNAGQSSTIKFGGASLPASQLDPPANDLIYEALLLAKDAKGLVKRLFKESSVKDKTLPGKKIKSAIQDRGKPLWEKFKGWLKGGTRWFRIAVVVVVAILIVGILIWAFGASKLWKAGLWGWRLYSTLDHILKFLDKITLVIRAAKSAKSVGSFLKNLFASSSMTLLKVSKASMILSLIFAIIEVVFIWYAFFSQSEALGGPGSLAYNMALAYSAAATVVAMLFLALSLTGVGFILVLIISIIDGVLWLLGSDWSISGWLTEVLADALTDVEALAEFNEDATQVEDFTTRLRDIEDGLQPHNTIYLESSVYSEVSGDSREATEKTRLIAGLQPQHNQTSEYRASGNGLSFPSSCDYSSNGKFKSCHTPLKLAVTPYTATRDLQIPFRMGTFYHVLIQQCNYLFGIRFIKNCSTGVWMPDDPEYGDWNNVYFDIFPDSLDGLWAWDTTYADAPSPLDRDGDGLADGSDPNPNDWDADDDGLSDRYERSRADLNPLDADTDDDGLDDADELRYGTFPNQKDSDKDGLDDALEVQGWTLTFGGAYTATRAFPDPLQADADGDDLNDLEEWGLRSNPNAYNLIRLPAAMSVAPDLTTKGQGVTYTLRLRNRADAGFSSLVLTVTLPTEVTADKVSSEGTVAVTQTDSSPYAWAVADMSPGDEITVTLQSMVDGVVSSSREANARLQGYGVYATEVYTADLQIPLEIDVDPPTTTVDPQAPGTYLRGTSYVLGGDAVDNMAWVQRVEVSTNGGDDWHDVDLEEEGSDVTWAWLWESLPADGAYTIRSRGTDSLGNVETPGSGQVYYVDNTPPTSGIGNLGDGDAVSATLGFQTHAVLTVTGSASDNLSGVDQVVVRADGLEHQANVASQGSTSTAWTFAWELPTPGFQTTHTLQVKAWDVAGNEGGYSTLITITVDNEPPTSDMNPPEMIISGSVTLSGTVAEERDDRGNWAVAGIEGMQVGRKHLGDTSLVTPTDLSGITWTDATLGGSGFLTTTTWSAAFAPPQDGFYALFSRAIDAASNGEDPDNEGHLYRSLVYADVTSPTAIISSPQTGLVTNRPVIEVQMTATDPPYGYDVEEVDLGVTYGGSTTWYTETSRYNDAWLYFWEPGADGVYTLTARAADAVGWLGYSTETVTVTLVTAAPEAGIGYPTNGDVVSGTQVIVQGSARSAGATTVETVTVQIDPGSTTDYATLLDSGSVVNWVYTWTPSMEGEWILGAYAEDSLSNVQTETVEITVTYDISGPVLFWDQPPASMVVTATTYELITGTVWDLWSDVRDVKVVTGTGEVWQEVADVVSNGVTYDWTYTWTLQTEDWVTHTVTVGAWDLAGNLVTTTRVITVDNVPPRPIGVFTTTFTPTLGAVQAITTGYWFTAEGSFGMAWDQPYDGGGIQGYSYMWDNVTDTLPADMPFLFGESFEQGIASNDYGVWYLHLRTFDHAGHSVVQHLGPWYVDTQYTPSFDNGDGVVGLDDNEHIEDEEFLGSDNRAGQGDQSFYVTWDADNKDVLYLAWQGARWASDGDLFIYLDTDAGGTATGYAYGYTQTYTLPFSADYLLWVEDDETWGLRHWSGSAWVTVTLPTTATLGHDTASAGTEIHLPMAAVNLDPEWDVLRMAAIAAEEESPELWAVFPNTNALDTFTLTDEFTWGDLGMIAAISRPAQWQPIATNLTLDVGVWPTDLEPVQDSSFTTYTIHYRNDGTRPVPWVQISVTSATTEPMHGLSWYSWQHSDPGFDPSAADCTLGATTCMWWVGRSAELDEALPVSATGTITLVGRVQMMPFTSLDAVTATILFYAVNVTDTLADSTPDDNAVVSVHLVDNDPPEVDLGGTGVTGAGMHAANAADGYVSPGTATIEGSSSDDAAGVASVEVKVGSGGSWQAAGGDVSWSATVSAPQNNGDKVTVYARATDRLGRVSDATSFEYTVDATPPTVTVTNLASGGAITEAYTIRGTASDPYPSGGEIASVEVSQDGENWSPVDVWTSAGDGSYNWSWYWPLVDEEGVARSFWFRSRDAVGNITASPERVDVVVDTHIPQSSITSPSNGAIISGTVLIQGTAGDGSGVAKVEVSTDGGTTWHTASGTTNWSYTWQPTATGSYTLKSRATDIYGNVEEVGGGVRVTISNVTYKIYVPVILRNYSNGPGPAPPGGHWIYLPLVLK